MSRVAFVALLGLVAGCGPASVSPRPGDAPPSARPELAAAHDPAACGGVAGRVTFAGPVPVVPDLLGALPVGEGYGWVTKPNPFAPRVAPDGGLANVLVWLDGVDPARSKPWGVSALELDIRDAEFQAGGKRFVAGVARTGGPLTVTSRDATFASLRGRGAAFFALPFPTQASTVTRTLDRPGVVELSCATTAYWMAADVLVHDTPYACVTGGDGRYALDAVPAGDYTLRVRARDWRVTRTTRDPESGLHAQQFYAPPVVKSQLVTVYAGATVDVATPFAAADFGAK